MSISKHRLAYWLFPRYSLRLDQLNNNALLGAWIKSNNGVPFFPDRQSLYMHIEREFLRGMQIDYLEFGVFRGDSLRYWVELNTNPSSRFFGFDSFIGLPEDWGHNLRAGAFDVGGMLPDIADLRVTFVKGWFQDMLPPFLDNFAPQEQSLIHIDCDLHGSTIYCLTKLDFLIKPGTVIIFDEFASALHEFRAFNDYRHAYRREMHPIGMTSDFAAQAAFLVTK